MTTTIDNKDYEEILRSIDILQGLEPEAIRDIAESVSLTAFKKDQTIIGRGHTSEYLYIIYSGEVEIVIPDSLRGVDRRVHLKRGSIVGEISLLTKQPYSADVIAIENTSMLFLDSEQFSRLIEKHKSFAKTMSNLVGERMSLNGGIDRVGKYKLLSKLGEGNMAIVFNAYDPKLERHVAIKMLKYELSHDPEFLKRFKHEARIIARLNHPNIVDVYETLDELSTGFMVMEKLPGLNLSQILKEEVSLDVTQTRSILMQIANALHHAHTNKNEGIVHRDIKPSNIIVDESNHVTITDFGIAGAPSSDTDSIEGSPHYLSPEVIQAKSVDGRADIYALGILAFHMLTGSPPFVASSVGKIFDMHLNQEPPDIRKYRPEIDESFATFIDQALLKDPEQRISDWNDIKMLLQPATNIKPLKVDQNEAVLLARLQGVSYPDAAKVLEAFERILDDMNIEHELSLELEETAEDTMNFIAAAAEELQKRGLG